MRSPTFVLWVTLACAGSIALVEACSKQKEGERCDANNGEGINGGESDCGEGLECWKKTRRQDHNIESNSDICCPANLGTATALACIPGPDNTGGGGGAGGAGGNQGGGGAGGGGMGGGGMGGGGMAGGGMGGGGMAGGGMGGGGTGGTAGAGG